MNGEDIERAVRRRVRRFDGVFAAERLPNEPRLLDLYVCNKYNNIRFCHFSYNTRCYFNVRSKADISQLNLPHGTDN